jgi:hypothetical protein
METVPLPLSNGNSPRQDDQPKWVRILRSPRSRAIAFAVGTVTTVIRLTTAIIDLFYRHRE